MGLLETRICVDTARYIPANILFKDGNTTKERTVRSYELVYFIKSGGHCVINGKKYPISADCVRFLRPGDRVYSYRFFEVFVVHFTADEDIFDSIPSFMQTDSKAENAELMKKIIGAFLASDKFETMKNLWRLLDNLKTLALHKAKVLRAKDVFLIKRYIEENSEKNLTLEKLAEIAYMHPVYLQRKFKKQFGLTPTEYIKSVRLSRAKNYLLTTEKSLEEIAQSCGFCNTSYFIKLFKAENGITPLQFRLRDANMVLKNFIV